MAEVRLFNTAMRRKEPFAPLVSGTATIYTCGPTVYDKAQIGNLRAFVSYDVLVRTLASEGFEVNHVMNITDVDDKTIRRSREEGVPLKELTDRYIDIFFADLNKLNIRKASRYPRATEHIKPMVRLVKRLMEKGMTYTAGGSVYFRISEFSGYGKLSGTEVRTLRSGMRVEDDEYEKEEAADFVLWKAWKEEDGDVFWETDIGRGRPGWHIECSAMAMEYLGETVDIHGGGIDLVFPHHENEIAQSEGATGKPFVRTWVHNGWLLSDGKKMSKSQNNYYVLADLEEKGLQGLDLRYYFLTNHYRQQFNFLWLGIESARTARHRIVDWVQRLAAVTGSGPAGPAAEEARKFRDEFAQALADDLNTPQGLGALHNLMGEANRLEASGKLTAEGALAVLEAVREMDAVLGILPPKAPDDLTEEEKDLLDSRAAARTEKNWARADELRDALIRISIAVEDTPSGQRWKRM
jgi:cysteinyl-tRNA synthetase